MSCDTFSSVMWVSAGDDDRSQCLPITGYLHTRPWPTLRHGNNYVLVVMGGQCRCGVPFTIYTIVNRCV